MDLMFELGSRRMQRRGRLIFRDQMGALLQCTAPLFVHYAYFFRLGYSCFSLPHGGGGSQDAATGSPTPGNQLPTLSDLSSHGKSARQQNP